MTDMRDEIPGRVSAMVDCEELQGSAAAFMRHSAALKYSYNFHWLGRPVIQYPQDLVAMQELIWDVRPDLIIETGIAHGGSLVFSASMLALLDVCDASPPTSVALPGRRKVVGVDIDIRSHNREALDRHPLRSYMQLIEGSSIADDVVEQVHTIARDHDRVLVCLDSMHTHDHVLAELEAYAPLVSPESYLVVFDTIVEDLPEELNADRPWTTSDNPRTAVREFLSAHDEFVVDESIPERLLITVAPGGYLKRTSA